METTTTLQVQEYNTLSEKIVSDLDHYLTIANDEQASDRAREIAREVADSLNVAYELIENSALEA